MTLMASYKNNHVLSACLLRRFTDARNTIIRSDKSDHFMQVPVIGQGYRKRLWRRTSAQFMENLWSDQAESKVSRVFAKLDAGQRLTLNDKKLLVRFMTVHYVRSAEFIRVYERTHQTELAKLAVDQRLTATQRYQVRLRLLEEMNIPSEFFENAMREYYEKCLRYLLGFGLEIGVARGEDTFILPDGGLLVLDSATRHAQPTGGVALLSANHAVMPLGPRHLAALTSKTQRVWRRDLSEEEVQAANTNLRLGIVDAYYAQPPLP